MFAPGLSEERAILVQVASFIGDVPGLLRRLSPALATCGLTLNRKSKLIHET